MKQLNWVPDLHIYIYEVIKHKYRKGMVFKDSDVLERMRRVIYRVPLVLLRTTIEEMEFLGLIIPVQKIGKIKTYKLGEVDLTKRINNSYRVFPIDI